VVNLIKLFFWLLGAYVLFLLITLPADVGQTVFNEYLPLKGKVIVIDPGHGGPDGGARGKDKEKTEEKTITLEIAKIVRNYLEQGGAVVYLTRETDTDLADSQLRGLSNRKSQDIRRRLQFIHDQDADLFISIHLNALPSTKWRGAQTFYYPKFPENKHLATTIQDEIIKNMENTTRTPLPLHTVYLLKYAKVPGALVEIGFLSNEAERELLKQSMYQKQMAASIYRGIIKYMEEPTPSETEK